MKRARAALAALAWGALLAEPGCKTAPVAPPTLPPPPATRPSFERTNGDISLDGDGRLIVYKDMRILVDPTQAQVFANGATADFVLFTSAARASAAGALRPDQKTIGPENAGGAASRAGTRVFKSLTAGQRLMLKKTNAFAFASAVTAPGADGQPSNGYLLEFDNGRNLVFFGPLSNIDPVREFVYGLRDDGKTVHLGYFDAAAPQAPASAALLGLIQPQIAVLTLSGKGLDRGALAAALGEQMFAGEWYVAEPRESIPF